MVQSGARRLVGTVSGGHSLRLPGPASHQRSSAVLPWCLCAAGGWGDAFASFVKADHGACPSLCSCSAGQLCWVPCALWVESSGTQPPFPTMPQITTHPFIPITFLANLHSCHTIYSMHQGLGQLFTGNPGEPNLHLQPTIMQCLRQAIRGARLGEVGYPFGSLSSPSFPQDHHTLRAQLCDVWYPCLPLL